MRLTETAIEERVGSTVGRSSINAQTPMFRAYHSRGRTANTYRRPWRGKTHIVAATARFKHGPEADEPVGDEPRRRLAERGDRPLPGLHRLDPFAYLDEILFEAQREQPTLLLSLLSGWPWLRLGSKSATGACHPVASERPKLRPPTGVRCTYF